MISKWRAHIRIKVKGERAAGLREPTMRDVSCIAYCPFTRRRCNVGCVGSTCLRPPTWLVEHLTQISS